MWLFNMLGQGTGAYPGEGAYKSEGGYSKTYGTCRSDPTYFSDDLRWLCFKETSEKCRS